MYTIPVCRAGTGRPLKQEIWGQTFIFRICSSHKCVSGKSVDAYHIIEEQPEIGSVSFELRFAIPLMSEGFSQKKRCRVPLPESIEHARPEVTSSESAPPRGFNLSQLTRQER